MARTRTPRPTRDVANWPVYHFAALETALEQGDFQAAAEARRELAQLGVEVRIRLTRPTAEPAPAVAEVVNG